jgi:hypothetical protein
MADRRADQRSGGQTSGRNRVVSTDNMLLELAKARQTRASAGGPAQPHKARG